MANFCMSCGIPLPIGSDSACCSAHGGPPLTADATSKCPFCSEHILATAKKCKHCSEFLVKRKALRTLNPGDVICPNPHCDYEGPPRKVAFGSKFLGGLLLVFFILPGVLYF